MQYLELHTADRPIIGDLQHHSLTFRMSPGDAYRLLALCFDLGWIDANDRRHHTTVLRKEPLTVNRKRVQAQNIIEVSVSERHPATVTIRGPAAVQLVQSAISIRVQSAIESEGLPW